MSRTYEVRLTATLHGGSAREFRNFQQQFSLIVRNYDDSSDAIVLGSEKDRQLRILFAMNAGSSSSAESKADRLARMFVNRWEQSKAIRRVPEIERELVLSA